MDSCIAIDLGGTNLRVAIIDRNYDILDIYKEPTTSGDKEALFSQIERMVKTLDYKGTTPIGISIGVAGRVRREDHVDALPNIKIVDINFVKFLNDAFHLPVRVLNDAEVAVLAEAVVGAGKDYERVYFVTISTGLGGALAINKKLANYGKEIGHILTKYQDEYQDLEYIVSGTGIVKLCEKNDLKIEKAYEFFNLLRENDKKALEIYKDWIKLLAHFFNFVKKEYDPDVFCLTGGVVKNFDYFEKDLKSLCPTCNFTLCGCSENAGLIGSAVCILNSK